MWGLGAPLELLPYFIGEGIPPSMGPTINVRLINASDHEEEHRGGDCERP